MRHRPRGLGRFVVASFLVLVTGASTTTAAPRPVAPAPNERALRNLEAFAHLYGWVRWFHPSDEASRVDWDRMAVAGVERVAKAPDDATLRQTLEALFLPVAPRLRLHAAGEVATPVPSPPAGQWQTIAWQHLGLGAGQEPYVSARLHRPHRRPSAEMDAGFGTVTQAVPAAELRGKRVRLRAAVRAEVDGDGSQAQLWMRVDLAGGGMGFFDNMNDRPIRAGKWQTYEIVGEVAPTAERVAFGCLLQRTGKVWVDGVELAVEEGGSWRPVAVVNSGFEAGAEPTGWSAKSPGYRYSVVKEGTFAGQSSLLIETGQDLVDEPLFAAAPALGEAQDGELVNGLFARVPLAVPGDAAQTWPPAGASFERLQDELGALDSASWSGDDWRVRAAAVIVLWNIYQHFYPYFDVVQVDWPAELREGLRRALTDADARAFLVTLKRMVAAVQDGHGNVFHRALFAGTANLPYLFDVIESKVVVTAAVADAPLRRGDVVLAIDGEDAAARLAALTGLRSGSPQWRQHSALWEIGRGPADQLAKLRIERDGATLELAVPRGGEPPSTEHMLEPTAELPGGVLYVDLTRLDHEGLQAPLAELAKHSAVVFDLRGYPKGGAEEVLQHLTDTPIQSAIWQVPQIVYPDRRPPIAYDRSGRWELPPAEPRYRGKVAFLTSAGAISYAESVMGIVEGYHLGAIVGSNTAGTNGNINMQRLPGGYGFIFTGMQVLKHDGSRHHLVGIAPTVPVTRTLAALRAGRDEELEAALRVVGAVAGDGAAH